MLIHITTEHEQLVRNAPLREFCPGIISRLQEELSARYTRSLVSVSRGGVFQTWHKFLTADIVICSASTFCFWPALSNIRGAVYLPHTPLLGNGEVLTFGRSITNVKVLTEYNLVGIDPATMDLKWVLKKLLEPKAAQRGSSRQKKKKQRNHSATNLEI